MLPGLLNNVFFNHNRGNFNLNYFETGKIYTKQKDSIKEEEMLGLVLSGKRTDKGWNSREEENDFFTLKGVMEVLLENLGIRKLEILPIKKSFLHPKKGVEVKIGSDIIGIFGEVSFEVLDKYDIKGSVQIAEISIEKLMPYIKGSVRFQELPKYPQVTRDIAFLVDKNITHKEISNVITSLKIETLEEFHLFDIYCGEQISEDKKSLAYSFRYRDKNKTLKDEEVSESHDKIINILKKELGCIIRT
jgi:phenylalanyl-tRNA synthetase beta chain